MKSEASYTPRRLNPGNAPVGLKLSTLSRSIKGSVQILRERYHKITRRANPVYQCLYS